MANNDVDIIVRLKNLFSKEAKNVNKDISTMGKNSDNASKGVKTLNTQTSKLGDMAKKLVVGGALLAIGKGLFNIAKAAVGTAAQFEQYRVAFNTMLGSASKANKLLKDIENFASSTPFQLPGLIEGSKRLLAFGIGAEDVVEKLRNLGNAAQGNSAILDRLTLAYGKLKAKGKASLEELNMFTEAGVPIMQALADQYGVTTQELFKLVSTGKVGFEDVDKALTSLTTGSGQFAGLIEKQSQTFAGLVSTLKDNINLLGKDLGELLLPLLKNIVNGLLSIVNGIKAVVVQTKLFFANATDKALQYAEAVSAIKSRQIDLKKQMDNLAKSGKKVTAEYLALSEEYYNNGVQLDSLAEKTAKNTDKLNEEKEALEENISMLKARTEAYKEDLDQRIYADEIEKEQLEQLIVETDTAIAEAQRKVDSINAIKEVGAKKQQKIELNSAKASAATEKFKAEEFAKWQNFIVQATASKNKEVAAMAKAVAIYDIGVKTFQAAMGAFTSLVSIPYVGPVLAIGAAAAATAFGVEQANAVASQKPSFATGGVVGGFSGATTGGDNTTANVRSGEMLLNADEQKELFDVASGTSDSAAGGDLTVNVVIDDTVLGQAFVKNYNNARNLNTIQKLTGA